MVKILTTEDIKEKLKEILEDGEENDNLFSSIESLVSELESNKKYKEYSEWNQE